MNELNVTRWQGGTPPTESHIRQRLAAKNLSGYIWSNQPFDEYPPHSHSYDKVIYVIAGSITWLLPQSGEEITTFAGDRLDLPRGTVHGARVGANGVTCIEAHL